MAASRPLHGSVAVAIGKAKAKAKANGEIESYSSSTDYEPTFPDVQIVLPVDHHTARQVEVLARQVEIFMIDVIFTPIDLPYLLESLQPQLQDNPHIVVNYQENPSAPVHAHTCSYLKSILEQWYVSGQWDMWFGDDEDGL